MPNTSPRWTRPTNVSKTQGFLDGLHTREADDDI